MSHHFYNVKLEERRIKTHGIQLKIKFHKSSNASKRLSGRRYLQTFVSVVLDLVRFYPTLKNQLSVY